MMRWKNKKFNLMDIDKEKKGGKRLLQKDTKIEQKSLLEFKITQQSKDFTLNLGSIGSKEFS